MLKIFKIDKQVRDFFSQSLRPFPFSLVGLFFVTIFLSLAISLKPFALRTLLNFLAFNDISNNLIELSLYICFYLLASLFPVISYRIHNFIWSNFAPALRHHVNLLLIKYSLTHPFDFFQNHAAGTIANTIKEVTTKMPELIKTMFDGFLCGFLSLLIAMITVGSVNYKFSLGLFIWVSIYVIGTIIIIRRAKELGKDGTEMRSKIQAKMVEIFENIKCIRLFIRDEYEQNQLRHMLDNYLIIDKKKERSIVKTFAFQGFSFIIYQTLSVYWLVDGILKHSVSIGDFALILIINFSFVDFLRKISQNLADFADFLGSLEQGIKMVAKEEDFPQKTPIEIGASIKGKITFENVSFNYKGFPPLFIHKSVEIKPGEKVAIVGHSGSGKSTFINLMLRLYEINSGKILIDNKDITHLPVHSLRKAFSVVPQTPSLFYGSLLENIRYGRIEATNAEVKLAAKQAQLDDFISSLPCGYDTYTDSFGLKLSAGQRQRIAIARAILKNAPIFLLDEGTSHLDTIIEGEIQKNLLNLIADKTLIMITHRPTPLLLSVDKILVFDSGKIVEEGKHDDLLAENGLYKKLWSNVETFQHSLLV